MGLATQAPDHSLKHTIEGCAFRAHIYRNDKFRSWSAIIDSQAGYKQAKPYPAKPQSGFMPLRAQAPDLSRDMAAELAAITRLATLMDSQFKIPGTDIRLGIDTIIGFVPGLGDSLGLLVSVYIIYRARRLGAKNRDMLRMAANIGLDWLVGLVPLIGDLFDLGWKANLRNVAILEQRLAKYAQLLETSGAGTEGYK